jgi:hypothetical protein
MTTVREAAAGRAANIAARADRPSQRRCAELASSRAPRPRHRLRHGDPRQGGRHGRLDFRGYASVVERAYEMWDMFGPYTEIVSAAAFDATLARGTSTCRW